MPKITIKNLGQKTVLFEKPSNLLSILQDNQIDWMHACGGKGRCTTCSAIVHTGSVNLASRTEVEEKYLSLGRIKESYRLACQTICHGDIEISTPKAYKLPHLSYSD